MCSSLSSSFVRSLLLWKIRLPTSFLFWRPVQKPIVVVGACYYISSSLWAPLPCPFVLSFVVTGGIIWQRVLAKGPAAAAAAQLTIVLNSIISIPFNLIMLRNWTFVAQLLRLKHSNKMWRYGLACAVRNRKASANSLAIRRYYHRRRRRRSSSFSFPLVKESELGIYK